MARHRRTRAVLTAVTALITGWLAVLGTATAAPAQTPATAAVDNTAQTPTQAAEEVSPLVAVPTGIYLIKNRNYQGCLRAGPATNPQFGEPALYVGANTGCVNDLHSLWTITPADPAYGSQYMEVRSVAYNNRCLDVNYTKNGQPTGIIRLYTCHGDPNQAWDFTGGTSPYGGMVCVAQYGSCDRLLEPNGMHDWDYGGALVRFGERHNDYTEWWILERVA